MTKGSSLEPLKFILRMFILRMFILNVDLN